MTIYIASDHGGFPMKQQLAQWLRRHYTVKDLGPDALNPEDDFTDYAFPLAKKIAATKGSLGILLCRNGEGVCIAANKVKGIRAITSLSSKQAKSGRRDDHANVLCLPADYTTITNAKKMILAWLNTRPSTQKRYTRRLKKIEEYEKNV